MKKLRYQLSVLVIAGLILVGLPGCTVLSIMINPDRSLQHPRFNELMVESKQINTLRGDTPRFLRRSLDLLERTRSILGRRSILAALVENMVALGYSDAEQHEKAIEHYLHALDIMKSRLGSWNVGVASIRANLGRSYVDTNQYAKAREQLHRAANLQERLLPPSHPSHGLMQNHMGDNERRAGHYKDARKHYLKGLKLEKYYRGPKHRNVAVLLSKMGQAETGLGRYEKAAEYFRAEMKVIAGWSNDSGGRLAESMNGLSKTLFQRRKFKHSVELLHKAIAITKRKVPHRLDRLSKYHSNISAAYRESGNHKQALAHGRRALQLALRLEGKNPEALIDCRLTLGRLYLYMNRADDALVELRKALEGAKQYYPQNDRRLAIYYRELSKAYMGLFRLGRAERILTRAQIIARNSLDTGVRLSILDSLAELATSRRLFRKALKYRRQALKLGLNYPGSEPALLYVNLAVATANAGKFRESLEFCHQALKRTKEANRVTVIHQVMGTSLSALGKPDQGRVFLLKRLRYLRKKYGGDDPSMRIVWKSLGQLNYKKGLYTRAIFYLRKVSLRNPRTGLPTDDEISVRNLLALSYNGAGKARRARTLQREAVRLALERYGDESSNVARAYAGMGVLYYTQGEHVRAEEFMNRALKIYENTNAGNPSHRAALFSDLGLVMDAGGKQTRAIRLFERAIKINRKLYGEGHDSLASNYANLGRTYLRLNNLEKAEENFRRALDSARAVYGAKHPMIAVILGHTGRIREARNDYRGALGLYEQSLRMNLELLSDAHPAVARNYFAVARIMAALQRYRTAEILCRKAIKIFAESLVRDEHIRTLYAVAELNRISNRNRKSVEYLRIAVDRILRYRLELGRTRIGFTERYAPVFDRLIDMELALGNIREAFRANMRKQGLSLVEGVSERYALVRGGVPARLRRKFLRRKAHVTARADAMAVLEKQGQARLAFKALQELHKSERKLSRLQSELLKRYPGYAALRRPEPPNIAGLRQSLRPGETIVSYSISGAVPTAFVLGRKSAMRAPALRTRTRDLETKARNLHTLCRTTIDSGDLRRIKLNSGGVLIWNTRLEKSRYTIRGSRVFQVPTKTIDSRSGRLKEIGGLGDFLTANEAEELRDDLRRDLYRILVKPVMSAGTRGLIIIPDGPLHYVPFGILMDENGRSTRDRVRLRTAPSANVWYNLRRARNSNAPLSLFAVGDAIYNAGKRSATRGGAVKGRRAVRALEQLKFANLPGTAGEVREITRIAYGQPGKHALLGVRANRDLLLEYNRRGRLARYRILHFAVHGLFVEGNADLNALVLSLPKEAQALRGEYARYRAGHGEISGTPYLRLGEVKTLRLNSRLVVLSACETSLGVQVSGEGMMGLPQAFLMAGSRSVIASLWAVDDKATGELMTILYRNMLRRGMEPEQALRAAQAAMRKKYPDPYYWAAFVYYGR